MAKGKVSAPFGVKAVAALSATRVFGDSIELVVIPWAALKALNSVLGAAGVLAIQSVPWVIIPLIAGSLIDRVGGKAAAASLALQAALLTLLALIGPPTGDVTAILTFYVLILAISALDNVTTYLPLKAIPALVGKDEGALQKANATVGIAERSARIAGYVAAAPLAVLLGLKALLLDAAALLLVTALTACLTPNVFRFTHPPLSRGDENASTREGRTPIPRFVKYLIISALFFNFAVGPWRIFLLDALKNAGSLGEVSYAVASASVPLAGIAASVLILRASGRLGRSSPPKQFVTGCLIEASFVASLTTLYLTQSPQATAFLAPALTLILGFGDPLINVSLHTVFQARVMYEVLGRVRGLFDALATATIMVSELATAYLMQYGISANLPLVYSALALLGALIGAAALNVGAMGNSRQLLRQR